MLTKDVAGVAGLPQVNEINGCDGASSRTHPAESAGNPRKCRTDRPDPIYQLDCKARRAPTPEKRMQAEIAKAATELVLLHGATDVLPFLDRQMTEVMK